MGQLHKASMSVLTPTDVRKPLDERVVLAVGFRVGSVLLKIDHAHVSVRFIPH